MKSFGKSLGRSPPTVALSPYRFQMHSASLRSLLARSLCRFHLRLLLFHFLAFSWRLRSRSSSNAFGFSAPSPFIYLSRSQRSLLIVSPSLYTTWRLSRKLSKEAIIFSSLSFPLSSSVASVSSDCFAYASLSLPTKCVGVDFRWNASGFEREKRDRACSSYC
jgi:hypothetical protein